MKTIKFISREKPAFTVAVRNNVNAYFREKKISTKGGRRLLGKAIVMLGLYLVPFILVLSMQMNVWCMLLLSALMGIGMAGTGMSVMHDAAHGSFSSKTWINELFGNTMYLIGGNVFNWKMQHNIFHHTFTNINGYDEDIRSRVVIRMSYEEPLRKMHRLQYIYAFLFYSLMTITKLAGDFFQLIAYYKNGVLKAQNRKTGKEFFILIVSKLAYLVVALGLPMILTSFTWWEVLIGFIVMHLIAGIIMSVVFQMAHLVEGVEQPIPDKHDTIRQEWAVHELRTTSNFAKRSRVLCWFIGGLNYQIEHHLFPSISHVHYKKIAPIVERTAREFGLPYHQQRTFLSALFSHMRILRDLGKHKPLLIPVKVESAVAREKTPSEV